MAARRRAAHEAAELARLQREAEEEKAREEERARQEKIAEAEKMGWRKATALHELAFPIGQPDEDAKLAEQASKAKRICKEYLDLTRCTAWRDSEFRPGQHAGHKAGVAESCSRLQAKWLRCDRGGSENRHLVSVMHVIARTRPHLHCISNYPTCFTSFLSRFSVWRQSSIL